MPEGAEPWNSDYLLPNEAFSVTLTWEGVYDFFCVHHEHAGMVGRIIIGRPGLSPANRLPAQAAGGEPIPKIAVHGFPSVDEIMRQAVVRRVQDLPDSGGNLLGSRPIQ